MTTTLARKWGVDVTTDTTLASGWVTINGINDFDPEIAPNLEDASDYSTNGWATSEVTMNSWTAQATFLRRQTGGTYDAGQELVRAAMGQFGTAARVGVRWYDKNGGPEAYSGVALVTWKRTNTAVKNLETAQVTFTGTDIALNMGITNPVTGTKVPVIIAAAPSGVTATNLVTLTGQYFTGTVATTGVKIGGTNATNWNVSSDGSLTFTMPTGSAGSTTIVVTNAAGASNNFTYTRG